MSQTSFSSGGLNNQTAIIGEWPNKQGVWERELSIANYLDY